jgi:alanyl-tRNA synthetase
MNQFKDVFTGQRKVKYKRAASVQKCIRAGGKHNDLDNVGFTSRHHTFFEMLGNFSFGDYFKEEAIYYAWEWVTKELALPIDRLYATVYKEDDEAFTFWEKVASPLKKKGRILRFGKKDNYWAMGDTGPCGPCSEIHFDRGDKFGTGPNDVVNGETERFVEIWNLVFMQYDQQPDGKVTELPKPSVDTGAGLERLTSVIQDVDSVFQIDIFKNIIRAISDVTESSYRNNAASHHIIADHLRALTFAIADGAGISNEGQGYVLRRILRRAARHGRLLDMHEPFIHRLVPVLVEQMGDAYPEIKEKQEHVEKVIKAEEESFSRTLDRGIDLFEAVLERLHFTSRVIPGEDVFRLYDTYGFPYDLIELMAKERGFDLDESRFKVLLAAQQERSKAVMSFSTELNQKFIQSFKRMEEAGFTFTPTQFVRGEPSQIFRIIARPQGTAAFMSENDVEEVGIILDKTPFYIEAGGQVDDLGLIENEKVRLVVTRLDRFRESVIHIGYIEKGAAREFSINEDVFAQISVNRRWDIMRNHTATHLAHTALRQVLGEHIKQSGSYVGPDRLRFDFSHHQPMTPDEIEQVEKIVNNEILKGSKVKTQEMDVESAKKSGAMALFGEKYGDTVRVVSVEGISKELCGGTHVDNTSQIGPFFITLETGIASGVRRLEAITGREAIKYMLGAKRFQRQVSSIVGRTEADAVEGVRQLQETNLTLQKEIKKVKAELFSGASRSVGNETTIGRVRMVTNDFGNTDRDVMAGWIDAQKARHEAVVAFGLGMVNGKMTYMASASHRAVSQLSTHVGNLSKQLLPQFGGRGGGKPSFAQGTVAPGTVPEKFFEAALLLLKEEVKKGNG